MMKDVVTENTEEEITREEAEAEEDTITDLIDPNTDTDDRGED